jgi:hypothetical protein
MVENNLGIEFADKSKVSELLSRYAPVRLDLRTAHLGVGDRLALRELIGAARWIDRIFWKQRAGDEWLTRFLSWDVASRFDGELKRLIKLNFGPWDVFDNDRPFLGVEPRPPGGNLYPKDLSRDEIQQYLSLHPEQRQSLLSHTTLVRREGDVLKAVPYEQHYHEELSRVALGLQGAASSATSPLFRDFLQARAKGLLSGSLRPSERLWIAATEGPIDIAIGPYEIYDDGLLGVKASYEATVMVRHPMTERLALFESIAPELERRLPGSVEPTETRRRFAIGVYDVAYAAGMTNMGGKAIAATLPNDETIRSEVGARLILFRNVISAKVGPILKPLAARVLPSDQLALVREDAFLYHALLHEMAHALSTCFVKRDREGATMSINEALGERYATIEECRADLLSMVFLGLLANRGYLPTEVKAAAAITFVVNSMRTIRFGIGNDYSRGAAIVLSYFLHEGSVRVEREGNLRVDPDGVERNVEQLAAVFQEIATDGNYKAAGELIKNFGSIPPEIDRLRPRLTDVAVDLEFIFDDSSGLR